MKRALVWASAISIAYTYVGFPALVFLRGLIRPRVHLSASITPSVSLVIAARNEENGIGTKLDNLLGLDYPQQQLEVIIASDGSTDETNAVVRRRSDARVRLLALPRVGKAGALNAAVATATGEILVFSDANSLFATSALRALVAPFADDTVGGVAGDQRYLRDDAEDAERAAGERRYWGFDRQLKIAESRAGSAVSATGAIYAIRHRLFREVPPGVTDDFATSTAVIAQGFRLVFAPDAVAWEPVAPSGRFEFDRKVRVITRGLRAVIARRELLDPRRHGFYALQLASHKVLRRMMAVPLVVLGVASPMLWAHARVYRVLTVAQAIAYACGIVGLVAERTRLGRMKIFALPAFFCLVNLASLVAIGNVLLGRRIDRWEPQRTDAQPLPAARSANVR